MLGSYLKANTNTRVHWCPTPQFFFQYNLFLRNLTLSQAVIIVNMTIIPNLYLLSLTIGTMLSLIPYTLYFSDCHLYPSILQARNLEVTLLSKPLWHSITIFYNFYFLILKFSTYLCFKSYDLRSSYVAFSHPYLERNNLEIDFPSFILPCSNLFLTL